MPAVQAFYLANDTYVGLGNSKKKNPPGLAFYDGNSKKKKNPPGLRSTTRAFQQRSRRSAPPGRGRSLVPEKELRGRELRDGALIGLPAHG